MSQTNAQSAKAENALALKLVLAVLIALVAWGASFYTWGVPGLYMPAVAAVPVMYILLVLISRG